MIGGFKTESRGEVIIKVCFLINFFLISLSTCFNGFWNQLAFQLFNVKFGGVFALKRVTWELIIKNNTTKKIFKTESLQ